MSRTIDNEHAMYNALSLIADIAEAKLRSTTDILDPDQIAVIRASWNEQPAKIEGIPVSSLSSGLAEIAKLARAAMQGVPREPGPDFQLCP